MSVFTPETIDFAAMTEGEILDAIKTYKLALSPDELLKIQNTILKRPPSVAECVLWSIQGSEHCSYRSSRPFLAQFVTDGPNVMLGPSEDAGIVEIAEDNDGHKYGVVMSHESHNHPSQVVPYEGAATGIGGNLRDVSCMGAEVIGVADPLRFGSVTEDKCRSIAHGVVDGIAGYGNPVGIPNIGGDVYFNESYNDNCLVNVVTLGVVRDDHIIHSYAPTDAAGYDLILVGKPTDNSGFGGASFASLELDEADKEANKGAVQEPNAFLKRHLLKSTYALFDILREKGLMDKIGFKDLGAGGVACAGVELAEAAGMGADINLDAVHKSMSNLHPSVILCSETQERYMWVAHPDVSPIILEHYNSTFDLPKIAEGARASIVGNIRGDDQFIVHYQGKEIVHARAEDVTKGLQYDRAYTAPERSFAEPDLAEPADYNKILLELLAHENIASRSPIYEQYDKNVQGISVIEAGEADAGVLQPFKDESYPEEIRNTGVALSVDQNPRYCQIDPYWGGVNAVVEAMRNVAAVGATPHALTDCLNFGNPEKPEQMWEFVEAVRGICDAQQGIRLKATFSPPLSGEIDSGDEGAGAGGVNEPSPVPIVSGNVSLYNESKSGSIAPSPVIGCLGQLNDVSKAIKMSFTHTDSTILMIGARKDECGGSVYYQLNSALGANLPKPDLTEVENQIFALTDAIDAGLVRSAHDISDGGVAVALAEMSFANDIGFDVHIPGALRSDKKLFGETGGFVIEVDDVEAVKKIFRERGVEVYEIGRTIKESRLKIEDLVDIALTEAKDAWINGLRDKL